MTRSPISQENLPENPGPRPVVPAALLIVVAAFAAYANTFRVPFIFDDINSIVENPTIRHLWPPHDALSPPSGWGFTVSGRPVLNLSLALNYVISGLEVWSYHALNLLIHVLAGLALFGIVRRTLLRVHCRSLLARAAAAGLAGDSSSTVGRGLRTPPQDSASAAYGDAALQSNATLLAFVVALLWTLHPLQTESVTYIVQRAESLMGLCFLLTLYGFVRAADSPHPRLWWIVSFLACLLGVGTKEVTALAPVLVLLYDRTLVSGSFRAAWQRHRWQHLTLAATWIPLALLLAGTGGNRGGTSGFNVGVSWSGYWLTQFEAVTRYLGLVFWPHPLVFDYGKVAAEGLGATLLWAIPVVVLAAATLVALWRWPVPGFLGAWFFALLAPTSVVPGTIQMIVEHRMYLPLAAVIAFGFGTAARWLDRRTLLAGGAVLALAAGVVTARRNAVYLHEQALWEDTLAKRPENARAHNNLGLLLYKLGRIDDAIARYRESLRLDSGIAHTHYNLGLALMRTGRLAEAVAAFSEAVRILPYYFNAHLNLGIVLTKLGRAEDALPHFAEAIRFDSSPAEAHFQFGVALAQLGRWHEAIAHYAQCLQLDPRRAEAHSNWGVALFALNLIPTAIEHFDAALRLKPDLPDVHFNLGLAFSAMGRLAEAVSHYEEAVRLNPDHGEAQLNLGIALAQAGRPAEALEHLQWAVRLKPDLPAAHCNLAIVLAEAGRVQEAIRHYETALKLKPDYAEAHYNLGNALLGLRRLPEARDHFAEAVRINTGFDAARDMLKRLQALPPADDLR